jgi:uncharacterized integral membrane protein (TIGR00698 family)
LLVTLGIAAVAWLIAPLTPQTRIVGAPVLAIIAGIAIRSAIGLPKALAPGVRFSSRRVLQTAIVLLGTGLSLSQVWDTGRSSLAVLLGTLIGGLAVMLTLGRLLEIDRTLTRLISVGTGICGASAIGALAPVLEADQAAVAYAISTVFLFNIVGVLLFPVIGHALSLSQYGFGLWAGTAINDTSSVVAASAGYGKEALAVAVVVKLTRTVMIIPITLIYAAIVAHERRKEQTSDQRRLQGFPVFILWFLVASALNTLGVFGSLGNLAILHPLGAHPLSTIGQFLIAVALAGVGLSADLRAMRRTGGRPVLLGLLGWVAVAGLSLLLQRLGGTL